MFLPLASDSFVCEDNQVALRLSFVRIEMQSARNSVYWKPFLANPVVKLFHTVDMVAQRIVLYNMQFKNPCNFRFELAATFL